MDRRQPSGPGRCLRLMASSPHISRPGPGRVHPAEHLLRSWLRVSRQPTIGDIGRFGGSPLIKVTADSQEFVLNRDTKRSAVTRFTKAAARAGGAEHLPWHLARNARGNHNRVSYLPDDSPTPGWYAYTRHQS
jgi:hypothetical protein